MRGDIDFERLVDQHYAALYRFAVSLCGHENDACDLVQQTFYLLAARGHQVKDATKVKSWLFTTLFRLFNGSRRRLVRFPELGLAGTEDELPPVPPETSDRIDWEVVTHCLRRLDEIFRAPVALFYLEDYSYQEIADTLQVPLGTVKSRLARGIASLQKMMIDRDSSRLKSGLK